MNVKSTLFCALALLTTGCATSGNVNPWEGVNRGVLGFNDGAGRYVLRPMAKSYRCLAPQLVEDGVSDFFSNLDDPIVAVSQLLQGKPAAAFRDTGRFLLNSTVSVGGLFDVAGDIGLEKQQEDFGQTLGVWVIDPGPNLVVPLWGRSSQRDGVNLGHTYRYQFNELMQQHGDVAKTIDAWSETVEHAVEIEV